MIETGTLYMCVSVEGVWQHLLNMSMILSVAGSVEFKLLLEFFQWVLSGFVDEVEYLSCASRVLSVGRISFAMRTYIWLLVSLQTCFWNCMCRGRQFCLRGVLRPDT